AGKGFFLQMNRFEGRICSVFFCLHTSQPIQRNDCHPRRYQLKKLVLKSV
ncbi:MAG: hypothetical protein ACI9VN_000966, partial [Patescibacteria group bacterium]